MWEGGCNLFLEIKKGKLLREDQASRKTKARKVVKWDERE